MDKTSEPGPCTLKHWAPKPRTAVVLFSFLAKEALKKKANAGELLVKGAGSQ